MLVIFKIILHERRPHILLLDFNYAIWIEQWLRAQKTGDRMKGIGWGRKSDGCLEVQAQSSSAGEWSMQCLGGAVCSAEPLLLWHWASVTWAGSAGQGLWMLAAVLGSGAASKVRADTSVGNNRGCCPRQTCSMNRQLHPLGLSICHPEKIERKIKRLWCYRLQK